MTEWLPIDTAPKNDAGEMLGPTILIWYAADELPHPAYWGPNPDAIAEGAWLPCSDGLVFEFTSVTHWMPLPAPPEATTEAERIEAMDGK